MIRRTSTSPNTPPEGTGWRRGSGSGYYTGPRPARSGAGSSGARSPALPRRALPRLASSSSSSAPLSTGSSGSTSIPSGSGSDSGSDHARRHPLQRLARLTAARATAVQALTTVRSSPTPAARMAPITRRRRRRQLPGCHPLQRLARHARANRRRREQRSGRHPHQRIECRRGGGGGSTTPVVTSSSGGGGGGGEHESHGGGDD